MQTTLIRRLERAAYHAQQASLFVTSFALDVGRHKLLGREQLRISPEVVRRVHERYLALLRRDLDNVEQGYYPRELLFQMPLRAYARALPELARDVPRVKRRSRDGDFRELPEGVNLSQYPPYYRRTFHWQTDGYLSEYSAAIYDVSVEILFRGAADIMRRQIIPPITERVHTRNQARVAAGGPAPAPARLLDVACGTGRALKQLATAHPDIRYHGVDLSPYYIKAARTLLADVAEVSLLVENAETLPYVDEYFDILTSVYLFHELPRNARRRVVREMYRVLAPGGLLVIQDSAQLGDSADIAEVLALFPQQYHEPFYRCYLEDDLSALLEECGFIVQSVQQHMVAKVVVAHKPEPRAHQA